MNFIRKLFKCVCVCVCVRERERVLQHSAAVVFLFKSLWSIQQFLFWNQSVLTFARSISPFKRLLDLRLPELHLGTPTVVYPASLCNSGPFFSGCKFSRLLVLVYLWASLAHNKTRRISHYPTHLDSWIVFLIMYRALLEIRMFDPRCPVIDLICLLWQLSSLSLAAFGTFQLLWLYIIKYTHFASYNHCLFVGNTLICRSISSWKTPKKSCPWHNVSLCQGSCRTLIPESINIPVCVYVCVCVLMKCVAWYYLYFPVTLLT